MSRPTTVALACSLSLLAGSGALAQFKTIPGEMVSTTATVVAVEQSSRMLTLRDEKGELHTMKVPEKVSRFGEIKPGDKVNAKYFDNITLTRKAPGEPDVNTLERAVTGTSGGGPGGTVAKQRRITATIAAVDMDVPSIAFTGPNDWKFSTKVQDKQALEGVKVGDRVDITWTEAVLVSLTPAGAASGQE
jgi:hypothetical protein